MQLSYLLPQIGIERCLAYPTHDLLLTCEQNLIRSRILILRRVHDPFDLVDEVSQVLLNLLADRTRLCLWVAFISKLRHLSLMESLQLPHFVDYFNQVVKLLYLQVLDDTLRTLFQHLLELDSL